MTNPNEDIEAKALKIISDSLALQSLLYDLDLLPEQLEKGTYEWRTMVIVAIAFQLGTEEKR